MPMPRSQQVCVNDTPYYHCVARCVFVKRDYPSWHAKPLSLQGFIGR
ncbi:hypothetical protein V6259_03605 [Marinomonas sp. TI.3.20]